MLIVAFKTFMLNIVMINVVMLSVIILRVLIGVVSLSVIMLNVVAPLNLLLLLDDEENGEINSQSFVNSIFFPILSYKFDTRADKWILSATKQFTLVISPDICKDIG